MNSEPIINMALQITASDKGGAISARKVGFKVKLAFSLWAASWFVSLALNLALLCVPELYELVHYANILRASSGIMITLQFAAAYQFILSGEILVRICTTISNKSAQEMLSRYTDSEMNSGAVDLECAEMEEGRGSMWQSGSASRQSGSGASRHSSRSVSFSY